MVQTKSSSSLKRQLKGIGLYLPMTVSGVDAYSTAPAVDPYATTVPTKLPIRPIIKTPVVSQRPVRYDLGLGKHQPVGFVSTNSPELQAPVDRYGAAQYLIEHEAVVEYPSPHRNQQIRSEQLILSAATTPSTAAQSRIRSKPTAFIRPRRFAADVIDIKEASSAAPPVAFVTSEGNSQRKQQWELNTPWVEMLIHEQQSKLQVVSVSV